jgi:hypothetical protein
MLMVRGGAALLLRGRGGTALLFGLRENVVLLLGFAGSDCDLFITEGGDLNWVEGVAALRPCESCLRI